MSRDSVELLVDPAISRAKFEREIAAYREVEATHRELGWLVLSADFPNVLVAFAAPKLRPAPVVLGAQINFDNYDLWAPSVRIVDPFTSRPLRMEEIPLGGRLLRAVAPPPHPPQPLLQANKPDEFPFLCLPGVREYHSHSGHTGDDWFLHRGRGEGTLYFIMEKLFHYGAQPIKAFNVAMNVAVNGFALGEIPQ